MIKNVWRDFRIEKPQLGQTELVIVPNGRGIKHGKYGIDIAFLCTEKDRKVGALKEDYTFDEVKAWLYIPEYMSEKEECEAKWIELSEKTPNAEDVNILIVVPCDKGVSIGWQAIDLAYECDLENKVFHGIDGDYSFEEVQAWMRVPKYSECTQWLKRKIRK